MKLHHALHLAINTGYYFWGIIGWSFDEVDSAFGFLRNPHFMTCGWPLPFLYSHGLSLSGVFIESCSLVLWTPRVLDYRYITLVSFVYSHRCNGCIFKHNYLEVEDLYNRICEKRVQSAAVLKLLSCLIAALESRLTELKADPHLSSESGFWTLCRSVALRQSDIPFEEIRRLRS